MHTPELPWTKGVVTLTAKKRWPDDVCRADTSTEGREFRRMKHASDSACQAVLEYVDMEEAEGLPGSLHP
eukprot:1147131-Pelagomonas_calceolata.AAC.11